MMFSKVHSEEVIYSILGKKVVYFFNLDSQVMVNQQCHNTNCLALLALKKDLSEKCPKFNFYNDNNPTSTICLKHLGGEIEIGQDKNGNELSFCIFKDKSSIIADSLIRTCKKQ